MSTHAKCLLTRMQTLPTTAALCALALTALPACGPDSVDANADDPTATLDTSTGEPILPRPPDLGSDAVVCGERGDNATSDEDFVMLAGCEIYQGTIRPWSPGGRDLRPLADLRVSVGGLGSSGGDEPYTLEGLERVEWLGKVSLKQDGIPSLAPLANLAAVEGIFYLFGLREITDCRGLDRLQAVGGGMGFVINYELATLDGLEALEWIGGDLRIEGNPKLRSLAGLSGLRQVDGNLEIELNEALPMSEIDALLSHVVVGGEIIIL